MATEMIRVDSDVIHQALKKKPKYLSKAGYFSQLIESAIAENAIKKMDCERERASKILRDRDSLKGEGISTDLSNQIEESIKTSKEVKKKPAYSESFEKFWSTFLSAPKKSVGSKSEAFDAWRKALNDEPAERLITALLANINDQRMKESVDEFYPNLKQAHSWLKKKDYSAWLDVVTVKQPLQKGVIIYD